MSKDADACSSAVSAARMHLLTAAVNIPSVRLPSDANGIVTTASAPNARGSCGKGGGGGGGSGDGGGGGGSGGEGGGGLGGGAYCTTTLPLFPLHGFHGWLSTQSGAPSMRITTDLWAATQRMVPVDSCRWPLSCRRPANVCVWFSTMA